MPSTSWNYRIVRHHDGNLSLCEVIYEDGLIIDIIRNPIFYAMVSEGQTKDDLIRKLRNALRDATKKPMIHEPRSFIGEKK